MMVIASSFFASARHYTIIYSAMLRRNESWGRLQLSNLRNLPIIASEIEKT
jgi:hypothetical protein